MSTRAIELRFTGSTAVYPGSYDSTKTNIASLIFQRTGSNPTDKFVGPMPIAFARPDEAATPIAAMYPFVLTYSSDVDWVFLADNSAAGANRKIVMYTFTRSTSTFSLNGFITLTYPIAVTHTIHGLTVTRDLYTTGTVGVSGTAVTGTSTLWTTSNIPVGCRIGFGSTDPTQISTWYEISAVGSNTGITLTGSAGTVTAGSSYVIEDLRVVTTTVNGTAVDGGLFSAKGLRMELFTSGGTTIAAAVSTDSIRAVYWLADASTVTNTTAQGLAVGPLDSFTQNFAYVIDNTGASTKIFKYNLRASLASIASGKTTSAFTLSTTAATPTGTVTTTNNGRVGTLNHGPASGVLSLYWITTTRVYRTALTNITSATTTWLTSANIMTEVPPGGVNTYVATGAMSSLEIAEMIDRLIIMTTGAAGIRSYVTQFNTTGNQFDHIFLVDTKQQDQSTEDAGAIQIPNINAAIMSVWSQNGVAYLCRNLNATATNQIYALPFGAHWTYGSTTSQRLITPSFATTNCTSFGHVYINQAEMLGTGLSLGMQPEPFRMYYRTSGITDDSGTWVALDDTRDLTGVTAANTIQFMFEFRTIGPFCLPARLYGMTVVYNDNTTDSHYQPSVIWSDATNNRFAWRFATAFGSTVPTLYVRLYDAVAGTLLVTDNTASPTGTFEKSTNDGGAWTAYNTTDQGNNTTYIRYTPASLGSNIKVRAVLTLA